MIKHWRIHNYIRKDRYNETTYSEQKELLELDENGSYRLVDDQRSTNGLPVVDQRLTQDRLGKVRLGKSSLGEDKPPRHKYGQYQNVLLTDEDLAKLQAEFPDDWQKRIERLSEYIASTGKSYKNHLATIRNWASRDKEKQTKKYVGQDLDDPLPY